MIGIIRKSQVSYLSLFFLLMAMYSMGTVSAITTSWSVTIAVMLLSVVVLLMGRVNRNVVKCNVIHIAWMLLMLLCLYGVLRGNSATSFIIYFLCFLFLLISDQIGIGAVISSIKCLPLFGVIFAAGCYWQYLFPDQYYNNLYPRFGALYQQSIRRQFTFHKMCTGFTAQTAVAAQFIVLGLMAIVYLFPLWKARKKRVLSIIGIILLSGGLLLTGKRSPILNIGAAFISVDLISVKREKKLNGIMVIALGLIGVLLALYILAPMLLNSRNAVVRILEYFNTDDSGDISNGRVALIQNAYSEFMSHPVMGIGWGTFSKTYSITGAHNIYLQLLCECGVVGFILVVSAMLFVLSNTVKLLKRYCIEYKGILAQISLKCSAFIQIYILVYGFFGNPIYDYNYILMYFLGLLFASICFSHMIRNNYRKVR